MDAFLEWLASSNTLATVVTAALSTGAAIVVLIYAVAFFQGRSISFWPPQVGEKPRDDTLSKKEASGKRLSARPAHLAAREEPLESAPELQSEIARLERQIRRQHSLLVHIYNLHKTRYRLGYWRVTYTIDSKGGVYTREEMRICPLEPGKVHFRQVILGVTPNVRGEIVVREFRATNQGNNQRLQVIEIGKEYNRLEYAVVLDPPATADEPAEIAIESFRTRVFEPLVTRLEDMGLLRVRGASEAGVELRLIAPPGIELTSFSISPNVGSYSFEDVGNLSSVLWRAENPRDSSYAYTIQARKR